MPSRIARWTRLAIRLSVTIARRRCFNSLHCCFAWTTPLPLPESQREKSDVGGSMNSGHTIVLAVAVLAVAAILWGITRKRRSQGLRERFGPEYDRVVRREGVSKAEVVLAFREKRRQKFAIRPLSRADRSRLLQRWNEVQGRFLDDPKDAVTRTDGLVADVMQARGYPVGDFEQRAADLS